MTTKVQDNSYHLIVRQFEQLSLQQLYEILALRQQVFMLEQQSLYLDTDALDQFATHICFYQADTLAGYVRTRILANKGYAKIERVVTAARYRGQGLAKKLLDTAMANIVESEQPVEQVRLSAQLDAMQLYGKWGFIAQGEPYDDGGILHKDMVKAL